MNMLKVPNGVWLISLLIVVGCKSGPTLEEKPSTPVNNPAKSMPSKPEKSAEVPDAQVIQTKNAGSQAFNPSREFQLRDLQRVSGKVGGHVFNLWVMDTELKRNEGMMFLKKEDFKDNDGMIFVFTIEEPKKFWMRNTLVDLDICYCGKDGTINSTYTMKSLDESTDYSSKKPSMYVVELKAGTLKRLGIQTGMKWEIPRTVTSKE